MKITESIKQLNEIDNKHLLFFGKLFQIRNNIHLRHLYPTNPGQLGSGWEHKALNDFYDELLTLIDELIEAYQGKYGLININIPESKSTDAIKTIQELVNSVDDGEIYNVFKESWIKNILDEISTLSYKTLYKLKYLK